MAVRTRPLTGDALDVLPAQCRRCVFWELGAQRPPKRQEPAGADRVRKQGWVTAQTLEAGAPGVVVVEGGAAIGFAQFAPARAWSTRGGSVPRTSGDALLLATAWLDEPSRGTGGGRAVVQAAVRETIRLDLRAVEAYGDRLVRAGQCVLPVDWLLQMGFQVTVDHPRYPLLRLDVRRVARWTESLEHAVDELLGRVQPAPVATGSPT